MMSRCLITRGGYISLAISNGLYQINITVMYVPRYIHQSHLGPGSRRQTGDVVH